MVASSSALAYRCYQMQPPTPPLLTPCPATLELTKLTALDVALFAAAATLAAALIGAAGALAVAFTNAVAARRQVRALAHREYLLRALQPVLDYTEAVAKGHELLFYAFRRSDAEFQNALAAASVSFDQLSGFGLIMRKPKLKKNWDVIKKSEEALFTIAGEVDHARANSLPLTDLELKYAEALKPLRQAVIDFRAAAERVLF